MHWFPLHNLPEDLIEYPANGINAYRNQVPFSIQGWPARTVPASINA